MLNSTLSKKDVPKTVAHKMYTNLHFEFFIIIFALYLISETNGKIVPCNVSVESKVCFLVDDYVTTGIEK